MEFRSIQIATGVHHTTVITWVKKIGKSLPDTIALDVIPDVGELDELETLVGKKDRIWIWTAVDHLKKGIIAWVMGVCSIMDDSRNMEMFLLYY